MKPITGLTERMLYGMIPGVAGGAALGVYTGDEDDSDILRGILFGIGGGLAGMSVPGLAEGFKGIAHEAKGVWPDVKEGAKEGLNEAVALLKINEAEMAKVKLV